MSIVISALACTQVALYCTDPGLSSVGGATGDLGFPPEPLVGHTMLLGSWAPSQGTSNRVNNVDYGTRASREFAFPYSVRHSRLTVTAGTSDAIAIWGGKEQFPPTNAIGLRESSLCLSDGCTGAWRKFGLSNTLWLRANSTHVGPLPAPTKTPQLGRFAAGGAGCRRMTSGPTETCLVHRWMSPLRAGSTPQHDQLSVSSSTEASRSRHRRAQPVVFMRLTTKVRSSSQSDVSAR